MAVIHIPRRHYTQPQGRVELAPEWLGAGAQVAVVPNADGMRCLLGVGVSNTGVTPGIVQAGVTAECSGSSVVTDRVESLAGGVSAVVVFAPRNVAGKGAIVSFGNTGTPSLSLFAQGGGLTAERELTSGVFSAQGLGFVNGRVYSAAFGFLPGDSALAYDGRIVSTSVASFTNTNARVRFGVRGVGGENLTGGLLAGVTFDRRLDNTTLIDLQRNPWQLFRAEPMRIYSLPSGGGGGSTHEVVLSNSTATPTSSAASIQQTHQAALSSSATTPTCSSLTIAQTHLLGLVGVPASRASGGIGITQTHAVGLASCSTTPTASSIAITTGEVHQAALGNSTCTPTCSAISIQQTHSVSLAPGAVTPTCSAIGIAQTHQMQLSSAATEPASSPISINQTHLVALASSTITPTSSPIGLRLPDSMVVKRALAARVAAVTFDARVESAAVSARISAGVLSARIEAAVFGGRTQ